jgi:endonuclease/exonuclease/phosphatase family metal-dependent hydrolase
MIYDIDGSALNAVYDADGEELDTAYNADGEVIYSKSSPNLVSVMSYNMQWFRDINGYASMFNTILSKYDPLIIGAQEFRSGTYGIGTISGVDPVTFLNGKGYSHIYETTGLDNGNAVISKIASDGNVPTIVFKENHYTGTDLGYQKAYFTINEKKVAFFNAHLATSDYESDKVSQAKELFDAVQLEESFILTGDFNTVCKSVNDTEYTTIMKQFVDAGYNIANCTADAGFNGTWTSGNSEGGTWYPCDHIITSADIAINRVVFDRTKIELDTGLSIDHIPVIAYLEI